MRLTKIHATLGPASSDLDTIRKMMGAGMDACRLNMSHCSHELGRQIVRNVRSAASERNQPVAIGADLKGPKLRIGDVVSGSVYLEAGTAVRLTSEWRLSDPTTIWVDYDHLATDVRPGDPILMNDGFIALRVEEVAGREVLCRVVMGGRLSSRKGVNLPGIPLRVPSLTEKDLEDLAFALEARLDFLYVSYARSADHIREVRAAARRLGRELPIVAKIERQEGVEHLSEIVQEADGICVARGDLGIEMTIGAVPWVQVEASRLCHHAGKFVMNGGQLLASMASTPLPLRAEVSDLATVVRDGLDAIVLSDETAAGDYPVEAVRMASHVLEIAEQHVATVEPDGAASKPAFTNVDNPDRSNWLSAWRNRRLSDDPTRQPGGRASWRAAPSPGGGSSSE